MRYDHMVKVNGIYYQAGEDAPEIMDVAEEEKTLPFSDSDLVFETGAVKQYTRTDINRMNKEELLKMAKITGIEGADGMTGSEIKERILSALGL